LYLEHCRPRKPRLGVAGIVRQHFCKVRQRGVELVDALAQGCANALPGAELLRLTEPAALFAAKALEWLHKCALKRGRKLLQKPLEERHRLRIALKNIRYTAEFFSSFFGGARPYIRAVSKLQEELGAFNDAASATQHLRDVEAEAGPQAAKAAGARCKRRRQLTTGMEDR
jgi:CHAD domain-containing protein